MVFSSLVFLFVFLTAHLIVYALVGERWHNVVLLVSSLIFYSWGGPQYLLLLVGDTFASWLFALLIERSETPMRKRLFLIGECVVLLGLLGIFKSLGFIKNLVVFQNVFILEFNCICIYVKHFVNTCYIL